MVFKKYKALTAQIASYEEEVFNSWISEVEEKKLDGLERPLLQRNKDKTLKVNFGKDTLTILQEVKHLKKDFPTFQIPENAKIIFRRFEDFRSYNNSLDKIVSLYNYLRQDVNDKEFALFKKELVKIDEVLKKAETTLNWKSDGIDEYLERVIEIVTELNERIRQTF